MSQGKDDGGYTHEDEEKFEKEVGGKHFFNKGALKFHKVIVKRAKNEEKSKKKNKPSQSKIL